MHSHEFSNHEYIHNLIKDSNFKHIKCIHKQEHTHTYTNMYTINFQVIIEQDIKVNKNRDPCDYI